VGSRRTASLLVSPASSRKAVSSASTRMARASNSPEPCTIARAGRKHFDRSASARIEPDAEDMRRAKEGRLARLRRSLLSDHSRARARAATRQFENSINIEVSEQLVLRSQIAAGPPRQSCFRKAKSSQPNHYAHDNGCPIWQPLRPLRGSSRMSTLSTCAERSRCGFPVSSTTSFANSPKRTR
jgi:hypothetical protein